MTIIPQDPCILKGTLKYNVDPIDAFSDEEIKNVLNMVGFNYTSDERGIYKEIGESGDNLSIGEKQLICIARAILRVIIKKLKFYFKYRKAKLLLWMKQLRI